VISQILTELDGLEELRDVVIIAATNRPDIVESALLRPGRFDRLLYIPPPNLEARIEIFKIHIKNKRIEKDIDLKDLAKRTEGYSGADISSICNSAVLMAIREHIQKYKNEEEIKEKVSELKVTNRHFEQAMDKIRPLSEHERKLYEEASKRFSGKPIESKRESSSIA